jgi:predicted chitinase
VPYYNYSGLVAALSAWPTFAKTGSDTVRRQEAAAFLANMHHESGGGVYVREINQANWPLYCSSGNCGNKQYYGRGPIQLSWDYNYRAAGDALGIDLLNNPDLVANDASVGWKTALWYWMTQRARAAQTSHDAMVNGVGFGETIRAINGGLECNGAGEAQRNSRINLYRNFTSILGVPVGNNLGC